MANETLVKRGPLAQEADGQAALRQWLLQAINSKGYGRSQRVERLRIGFTTSAAYRSVALAR
jgi:hypothetical protein